MTRTSICNSSGELLRRLYENTVKFVRVAGTSGKLAVNPLSFQ